MEDLWLPDAILERPLGSATLLECLAARLPWSGGRAELTMEFGGIWKEEPTRQISFRWRDEVASPYPWGVADQTVTELAACAIAVALCPVLLGTEVSAVATSGESFDYRLQDGIAWYGLEVSGTLSEDRHRLASRAAEKKAQLLQNVYGWSGYVIVVGFRLQRIRLSAHNFGEIQ